VAVAGDKAAEVQLAGALRRLEAKLAAVDHVVAEEKEKRLALEARLVATERELATAKALLDQQHAETAAAASARSDESEVALGGGRFEDASASEGVLFEEVAPEDDAAFAMSLYRSKLANGEWGNAAAGGLALSPAVCEGTFDGPTDDGAAWGEAWGEAWNNGNDGELRAESAFVPYTPLSHGSAQARAQVSEAPRPLPLPAEEAPTLWQQRAAPPPAPEGKPSHPMCLAWPTARSVAGNVAATSYEEPSGDSAPRQDHGRANHAASRLPEPRLLGEWFAPSNRR
jgi:hypothetical protein